MEQAPAHALTGTAPASAVLEDDADPNERMILKSAKRFSDEIMLKQ